MDFVMLIFLWISRVSLLFMLFGLYKPWMMLWWEDVQNRKKVIKVYGTVALVAYGVYWLLRVGW